MRQYFKKLKQDVAYNANTMESGDSLSCGKGAGRGKNGANPKSHTSRSNKTSEKAVVIILIIGIIAIIDRVGIYSMKEAGWIVGDIWSNVGGNSSYGNSIMWTFADLSIR
jgi:hypothetical protein